MAIDTDEIAPPLKPARLDLEVMSVAALRERIATLEGEIEQIRSLITAKEKSRNAADAIFKR